MACVLGITGGVGTGKSTVLGIFEELGAHTLSADQIARDVLSKNSPAYREVVRRFGSGVVQADGDIDRSALAGLVFQDSGAREDLNRITHPRIIERIQERVDQFRSDPDSSKAVLALEIPLLFECGLESTVDHILVVAAEQETQVRRLTTRSGISRRDALARIGAQMPLDEKIRRADWVIRNDGTIESLERSAKRIWDGIILL